MWGLKEIEKGLYGVGIPPAWKSKEKFFTDALMHFPIESIKKISHRPVLIVHGSEDHIIPLECACDLYNAADEPKELSIIQGADHVYTSLKHSDEVISITANWFKRYLLNFNAHAKKS